MGWDVTIARHRVYAPCDGYGGDNHVERTHIVSSTLTYNFSPLYNLAGLSIRNLHGRSLDAVRPQIEVAIDKLGVNKYESDRWAPTPGNAGAALQEWLDRIDLELKNDPEERNIYFTII